MSKTSANADRYADKIIRQAKWIKENNQLARDQYRIKQELKKKKK